MKDNTTQAQASEGEANMSDGQAQRVRTWKIEVVPSGVRLTLNGQSFDLATSTDSISFDLQRAAVGYAGIYEGGE